MKPETLFTIVNVAALRTAAKRKTHFDHAVEYCDTWISGVSTVARLDSFMGLGKSKSVKSIRCLLQQANNQKYSG
jgi:hypothetical protein